MSQQKRTDNRPLPERVADQLKAYILEEKLPSGQKLPTETALAEKMGVSRSTVREAIKRLESQHILTVRHGAGSFVSDNPGLTEDPLGLDFISDKTKLAQDLLEVRTLIEPAIAEMAARNASDEAIAEIERLYYETEARIMNGEDYLEVDIQFHQAIAQASCNVVVPNLMPIISTAVQVFTESTHRTLLQETLDTHKAVMVAIRNHDSVAARDAMLLHMSYNRNLFRSMQGTPDADRAPKVPDWVLELPELKKIRHGKNKHK